MDGDDRSVQRQASNAAGQAGTTAQGYGNQASGIYGSVAPTEKRWLTTPPGFTTQDLGNMETQAGEKAAGVTGALQENARLRATRNRNLAGISGQQDAIAQAAARAQGQDIQDVLASNARLKAQQQMEAARNLTGMYGQAARSQIGAENVQNQDIGTQLQAGKSGWLQNMLGIMGAMNAGGRTGAGMTQS